jgi:NhaA family Na+:H+ antiporter
MTFFFGVAMVHVTKSLRPGGSLYPFNKAATPLLGTLGGVLGPTMLYLALVAIQGNWSTESQGWAITIATDISVAWLVSTQVFKSGTHPGVEFLLLLAVADDVVGLIVIAVAFPSKDMHMIWLLLVVAAIAASALFRYVLKVEKWYYYVFLAGPISWFGLYKAGLHPALALCVIVPFIPGHNIEKFDHNCSLFVHLGLFFFALCNAGVQFNAIGLVTLNVSLSLIAGKTLGIFIFTFLGTLIFKLKLPDGMGKAHLALLAHISGVGLTVSLFVAELAFADGELRDQAKLGALLSVIVAPSSIILSKFVKVFPKTAPCVAEAIA